MLKQLRHSHKNQRGDTIVEVMIVLAVLGLAIGISYATANRSLLNARQAQENSEATEYVQAQIENLRVLAPNSTPANLSLATNIFRQTVPFCIKNLSANPPIETTAANCTFGGAGGFSYSVLIYNCDKYSTAPCSGLPGGSDTMVIQAQWPDVMGQGTDTVTQAYRVHSQ